MIFYNNNLKVVIDSLYSFVPRFKDQDTMAHHFDEIYDHEGWRDFPEGDSRLR